ncbi:serine phosphatase RsbU (regulator of sigma subunit) [Streptomyces sp. 2333.5]|uniref:SpoIIE family protein phosphatase n=1 Tax=unclassified Streptomyces TaxID=2593676 RepID=UPI00089D61B1|nr:serine phosphatase RsbU (regulator of sigma subunit) [Streptomyces sp. 2333.5]SEC85373.1 Serine phosphatase RsbU, regulator of sigma subunit [Streptomyces sp. 2314.4]SED70882.1 Serine phosphatase RsbU, regulator of sigma subunit [Streptomyces sp. 2112.2]
MRTTTSSPRDDDVTAARTTMTGQPGGGPAPRFLRASLPGDPRAAAAARRLVRSAFADWAAQELPGAQWLTSRLADEAELLVSELVTNAVVHAGTTVELRCRLDPQGAQWPGPEPYGGRNGERSAPGVPYTEAAPGAGLDGAPGPGILIEVSDHHPTQPIRARHDSAASETGGHGLQLISAVAESWGITYRRAMKTVWFRLPLGAADDAGRLEPELAFDDRLLQRELRAAELLAPAPRRAVRPDHDSGRVDNGALSFLAEASDLLSGQLDADQVAALAAQLIVPRLAEWCAVWLCDGDGGAPGRGLAPAGEEQRLAGVWHTSEGSIDPLRAALEKQPPDLAGSGLSGSAPVPVRWLWAHGAGEDDGPGAVLACPLVAGGRRLGTLLLGRGGLPAFPDAVVALIEDLGRRVARAVATARAYSRQERISQVLQRRLLPCGRAQVPGVESAVVYEPREGAWAGGDFWDLFDAGDGRWCFALGDVCGSGPEAAAVTGLARPVLRLLARDGFGVAAVLDRLNKTMAREAADSVAAVAAAVAAAGAGAEAPVEIRVEGEQARFLSLLYGEIVPYPGDSRGSRGARCTLASAGHPLPLVLGTDGVVRCVAAPQMLLGVVEDASYVSESFDLRPGETLLCVTDGVTERRSGRRLFDDEDGLATALAAGVGLDATALAEHLRTTVHAFGPTPPDDDLALLVLQAAGSGAP